MKTNKPFVTRRGNRLEDNSLGYPSYPAGEDIFRKYQEEKGINPEDIIKTNESAGVDEITEDSGISADSLDVPGSELDDQQENIGSEDEENNYYSLGGEDHLDLEEDQGT